MHILAFIGLCVVTTLACALLGLAAWWVTDKRRNVSRPVRVPEAKVVKR